MGTRAGKALLALALVASLGAVLLLLDVPNRIAALGTGNLDKLVRPTTEAAYGETVRLEGRAERPPIEVTAREPRPVRGTTPGVRVTQGNRLLAAPVTIRNVGRLQWSTRLGLTATVVDATDTAYAVNPGFTSARGVRVLAGELRLDPGSTARGVLVFEVPRRARVTAFTLTVGSGLTRTGSWSRTGNQKD